MNESGAASGGSAVPDLILYSRRGCHLCDESRAIVIALLDARRAAGLPSPAMIERDIADDPAWERAYFASIPVVELGDRRLELATSVAKLRALLATIDAVPSIRASA